MNKRLKQNIYASITVLSWALAFPLTGLAVAGLSPYSVGLLRVMVASVVLLLAGRIVHIRKPFRRSHILLFLVEGLMGFALYLLFFNTGMETLTSATSSIIVALTPGVTALGAFLLFGEKLKPLGWICMGTAFAGVCIILLWSDTFTVGVGILWTLAAVLVFAGYNLLNRKLIEMGYSSVEIVTYAMCASALELMVFLPVLVREVQASACLPVLAAVFLGITASAAAYLTWSAAYALAENMTEVTNYMFITPLLATAFGALVRGEVPDAGTYIGGIVILISVIIFGLKGK